MSYCDDCAKILHLGESKESKTLSDFHVTGRRPPPEQEGQEVPQEVPAMAGDEKTDSA